MDLKIQDWQDKFYHFLQLSCLINYVSIMSPISAALRMFAISSLAGEIKSDAKTER